MDDISLTAEFTGVHAIFAMTDYGLSLRDPAVRVEAAKHGISPEERYAEIEIQRGTNLARVAASPGVPKTLYHYVYSSLTNHSELSGGKYTQAWHFDSKAAVRNEPLLDPKSNFIPVGL